MKNYFTIGVIVALILVSQTTYSQSQKIQICTGGVCNSVAIYFPQPDYPKEAKVKNISGVVSVRVSVDEQGNVTSAETCSGHPLLRPEAEKAAMKAKFKPTTLSGQPVKFVCILLYRFGLDESKEIEKESQVAFEPTVISFGVLNDKTVSLPQPNLPKDLLQLNANGSVTVQVKINLQEGRSVSAIAVSGLTLFRKYAVEAAMLAKFQPIKIEGSPLYATGLIVYQFPLVVDEKAESKRDISRLPIIVVGTVNDKAKYLPEPVFPKSCRCSGIIKVQIVVDESGNVISASANEGNPLLRISAVQAARQTKFSPSMVDGPKIYVVGFLEFNFSPDGKVEK